MTKFSLLIADELVAVINDPARSWQAAPVGNAYDRRFVAKRSYSPKFSYEDYDSLRVTVVPGEIVWSTESRSIDSTADDIQLGFQRNVRGKEDEITAQADQIVLLVSDVLDYLRKHRKLFVANVFDSVLLGIQGAPFFPDNMDESQLFSCLYVLTYKVFA